MVRFSMARLASIFLLVAMCTPAPTTAATPAPTTAATTAAPTPPPGSPTPAPTTAGGGGAAEEKEEKEEGEEKAKPQNLVLGVSMVGCLLLAMGMWYLVHGEDPDIRKTGWEVISSTISIFVAVLIFTFTSRFFNQYVLDGITPEPELPARVENFSTTELAAFKHDNSTAYWHEGSQHFEAKRYLNQAFVMFWYGVLFLACMFSCKVGVFKKAIEKESREMSNVKAMSACSLLFAHCAGFAGMEGWGMVMTSKYRNYAHHLPSCWLLAAEAFMKWFAILTMCKWARDIYLSNHRRNYWVSMLKTFGKGSGEEEVPEEEEEENEQTEMFKETIEDGENDIYGLFVSFLIVQCLRFYITGDLPDEKGEDEEVWHRDLGQCLWLFLFSCICLGMSVPIECCWQMVMGCFKNRRNQSSMRKLVNHTGRRLKDIFINFCTMSFAWCFMYAVQMGIAISGIAQGDKATLQVLLPAVATLFCFAGIRVLDWVADSAEQDDAKHELEDLAGVSQGGGLIEGLIAAGQGELDKEEEENVDKRQMVLSHRLRQLPRQLMKCNAFIIGFSWENAFDTGVEGISAEFPEHATLVMTIIGIICCATILPAWYWFIVPMVTENGHKLSVVMINLHRKIKIGFSHVDFDAEKNAEHKTHVKELLAQVLEACHETKGMTMAEIQKTFDDETLRRRRNPIHSEVLGMNE